MKLQIHAIDLTVIIVYLVGIVAAGLWATRHQTKTAGNYFLAGRTLRWGVIGAALFATNISTVHLVGLAADGYGSGLVIGNFEWMAAFCLVALGLVFAPFYFRSRVATLPEYLERRFGAGPRVVLAVMAVVGALFIHIGMSLYAGATILNQFFNINVLASILIISAVTCVYTVAGGLKAVVVTETIQTVLLLLGAACVTLFGLWRLSEAGVHSYSDLQERLPAGHLSMIHTEGQLSWYAVLLGYPVLGIWYWCADQTIVQRVLGASTERDAQLGPLFAGFIKILPVFLMVWPGVIAWVLFRDKIGADPNKALPVLIQELIPVGLKGLIAAGLLAALMSTIAGALNSAATLVSIDIIQKLRPTIGDRSLVLAGRITACVVMVLAMAWSTQGGHFESIFKGLNAMIACLAPPITAVFLWGIFWPRGTRQAAMATLVGGFALGGVTFALDFPPIMRLLREGLSGVVPAIANSPDQLVTTGLGIPFMLQAWWLFVICSGLFFFVSLFTPRPRREQVEGLCWKSPWAAVASAPLSGISDSRVIAAALVAVMAALYWTFA